MPGTVIPYSLSSKHRCWMKGIRARVYKCDVKQICFAFCPDPVIGNELPVRVLRYTISAKSSEQEPQPTLTITLFELPMSSAFKGE